MARALPSLCLNDPSDCCHPGRTVTIPQAADCMSYVCDVSSLAVGAVFMKERFSDFVMCFSQAPFSSSFHWYMWACQVEGLTVSMLGHRLVPSRWPRSSAACARESCVSAWGRGQGLRLVRPGPARPGVSVPWGSRLVSAW